MKLLGEVQYEGERQSLLNGTYYTDVSFSLEDVDEADLSLLCHRIIGRKYTFGNLNYAQPKKNVHSFVSQGEKNKVELNYIPRAKRLNVFIKGSDVEEIEGRILPVVSSESLENLAAQGRSRD